MAGATVLLGVDGTAHGARQRARLLCRNAAVPVMVVAVGDAERVAAALAALGERLGRALMTLEPVLVCKRDGRPLAGPRSAAATPRAGRGRS